MRWLIYTLFLKISSGVDANISALRLFHFCAVCKKQVYFLKCMGQGSRKKHWFMDSWMLCQCS